MKAHIGVNADLGLEHTVITTLANAHDITQAHALLHGEEQMIFGESGYRGVQKREEIHGQHPQVGWHIAMMPGQRKAMDKSRPVNSLSEQLEKLKVSIRAKGEPVSCHRVPVRSSQGALKGACQVLQPVAVDVRTFELVDSTHMNFARAAGMSASAAWAKAQKRAPRRPKSKKSAANSTLVSLYEYLRIALRRGGVYADQS